MIPMDNIETFVVGEEYDVGDLKTNIQISRREGAFDTPYSDLDENVRRWDEDLSIREGVTFPDLRDYGFQVAEDGVQYVDSDISSLPSGDIYIGDGEESYRFNISDVPHSYDVNMHLISVAGEAGDEKSVTHTEFVDMYHPDPSVHEDVAALVHEGPSVEGTTVWGEEVIAGPKLLIRNGGDRFTPTESVDIIPLDDNITLYTQEKQALNSVPEDYLPTGNTPS